MNDLQPVDMLVEQVKVNTHFLKRIFFSRVTFVAAGVLLSVFLIAAISTN